MQNMNKTCTTDAAFLGQAKTMGNPRPDMYPRGEDNESMMTINLTHDLVRFLRGLECGVIFFLDKGRVDVTSSVKVLYRECPLHGRSSVLRQDLDVIECISTVRTRILWKCNQKNKM